MNCFVLSNIIYNFIAKTKVFNVWHKSSATIMIQSKGMVSHIL